MRRHVDGCIVQTQVLVYIGPNFFRIRRRDSFPLSHAMGLDGAWRRQSGSMGIERQILGDSE